MRIWGQEDPTLWGSVRPGVSDLTFWGPWLPICKMETTVDALRLALNKCTAPGKQQVCYQDSHGPKVPVAGLQGILQRGTCFLVF